MNLFNNDFDKEDFDVLLSVGSAGDRLVFQKKITEEVRENVLPEYVPVDYANRVKFTKELPLNGDYGDFTAEGYPKSINFYDFEVFMCDWCLTVINPVEGTVRIMVNDEDALKKYYNEHCGEVWCGYNSRNYDSVLLKAMVLGLDPKKVNDQIILLGKKQWEIDRRLSEIQLYDFDIFDGSRSLKQLEAYMGNCIEETEVDFDIGRQLTRQEIMRTVKYNKYDVEQTIEVFRRRKSVYDSQIALIDTFGMPFSYISLTQAQLTAKILECEPQDGREADEFRFDILPVVKLEKYSPVRDWFMDGGNRNYKCSLETSVCGIPHQYGWGGLHGCPSEPVYRRGRLFHVDVASYYPSMMIVYKLLTRNSRNPGKYEQIYHTRLALKNAGKKKEQAPYKIVLNGTYGICKDKYSLAYDPMQANAVCVNGQLLLTDLLEKLEPFVEVVQSNTDGLIVMCREDTPLCERKVMHYCKEWENRTGFVLEKDRISFIYQKDVNNYLCAFVPKMELVEDLYRRISAADSSARLSEYDVFCDIGKADRAISEFEAETGRTVVRYDGCVSVLGKLERKGAYVKELSELDNELPIVNRALVDYLSRGVLPETTVESSRELIDFQMVVRVKGDFKFGWHNGRFIPNKTLRVFASSDPRDTYVGRARSKTGTVVKFGNTPDNAFIENGRLADCGGDHWERLDRRWYVNLAYKRLGDYGIHLNKSDALF